MIRQIIFDLDGVLIESKEAHFRALNRALEDFGEEPISYKEHVSKYDGMPTREKLNMKGISADKQDKINEKKQEYTAEVLKELIQESPKLIEMFRTLRERGFVLSVASNSIRYTVLLSLFNLGVMRFVSHVVSNEDVVSGKPDPEMYLKCMVASKCGPRETLIIEDSYVGREAAFNSGAYLHAVQDPDELTLEGIERAIDKANGVKPKWEGNNMNILIPMAGAGSRFEKAGYTFPKPLIEVYGKPMIQVVVENLNMGGNYIFITRSEHMEKYNLASLLSLIAPGCKIIEVDHLTEGAACTTLLAKEYIDNDEQLFIANSDQFIDWDSSHFMYSMHSPHVDGGIPCFYNTHPKWSYAKVDDDGYVTDIKEKIPISTNATVGMYHWKRGSDYVKYAEQMIAKDVRVNGEFYVAPVYNEAIQDGKRFKTYMIDKMWGLGTPEDLDVFLKRKVKDG